MADREDDHIKRLIVLSTLHGPTTIAKFENEYRTKMRRLMQMKQERKNSLLIDFKIFRAKADYELTMLEFQDRAKRKQR